MNIQESVGLERMKDLYAIMAGIPAKRIELSLWRSNQDKGGQTKELLHGCGTSACAIGYATAYPLFMKQGFTWSEHRNDPFLISEGFFGFKAVQEFFKLSYPEAWALFLEKPSRLDVNLDDQIILVEDHKHMANHKRKVLARIRHYLVKKGTITTDRAEELELYEAMLDRAPEGATA